MNFFNKKSKAVETETVAPQQQTDKADTADAMPRHRRDAHILNSTQLQRAKDAKRLAETKLKGLEDSLMQLQAQRQWLRRYNETNMALEREKKRLFELGKQRAMIADEASMLERYDLFEGIHGVYQKLMVVREQIGFDKRGLSLLEREAEQNRQEGREQEKQQRQAAEMLKNEKAGSPAVFDRVCQAFQLTGTNEAVDSETTFLRESANRLREEQEALASLIAENQAACEKLKDELERLNSVRQGIEMHENMVTHGEALLIWLNNMQETDKLRTELQQKHAQAIRRQNEENDMLGKTFAQYQEVISKAETAEGELSMHRSYIHGQDGLGLQERALMLKGRRQMLVSALSLWKRISTGYESIEERSRRITALRLHIQQMETNVRQMEAEAGKAQRLCREKEYTYLLSKGQDIIQLRSDLREGVQCSVCGATHHPYHSDTILEQSKLIGEMKTDYELLASEANAKQQQLSEMQCELAAAKGELLAGEEALNAIRLRQNEDVHEWALYAELDSMFAECSETTNLDARTALLRQFIENVSRDAERAEKELEAFTFHQSRITQLSEELQKLEARKSEINVRLGELNTGCQVLSREVEQTGMRLDNVTARFTRLYENVGRYVTIKNWYTLWQNNPEQLYDQIQKLITTWSATERNIADRQQTLVTEETRLEGMKQRQQTLELAMAIVQERAEDIAGRKAENVKTLGQIIPDRDAKTYHERHQKAVESARLQFEEQRSRTDAVRHAADILQGRQEYYLAHIARLEQEQTKLGEKLDLWMHAFNLRHPPVQQSELDEVFQDGKDWSRIRSSLKQISTDLLLCQAKVDDLNSRIIALETEDGHVSATSPDIQESIAARQQALSRQRSDTMMQIARLAVLLEDHEKALAAERNSAEPNRSATDVQAED